MIEVTAEADDTRRPDVAVVVASVLALAGSGSALLVWAESRRYSDNQRSLAHVGGWSALAGAGIVLLFAAAGVVRRTGSPRTKLAFAALLALAALGLFAIALVAGD